MHSSLHHSNMHVQSDIPGPGSYKTQQETLENMSVSFSKRGTGGFASKVCMQ